MSSGHACEDMGVRIFIEVSRIYLNISHCFDDPLISLFFSLQSRVPSAWGDCSVFIIFAGHNRERVEDFAGIV